MPLGPQSKYFVFTDADLDGAGSYLTLKWLTGKPLKYKATTVKKFEDDFKAWLKRNDITTYETVYILDLDVSQSDVTLFDLPNVKIIDHHKTHVEPSKNYKHAEVHVKEYSSCAKLIYSLVKAPNLTNEQKKLILLVDDYDSWSQKIPASHDLNMIFWNYQGDRLGHFVKDFPHGFKGFNTRQLKVAEFYNRKLEKLTSNLQVFKSTIRIQKQDREVFAVYADTLISDIGHYVIETHKADIVFVINLGVNRVSIRRSNECDVDVGKLAQKLIDGGGHPAASGGVITEQFLNLSKMFLPV